MGYIENHRHRYGAFFANEPWWEMHMALYQGPGHDWEGADVALDQIMFALAKARGHDTTQVCPHCKTVVDEPRSLNPLRSDRYPDKIECHWCVLADEIDNDLYRQGQAQLRAAERAAYEAMTPEQRAEYDLRT